MREFPSPARADLSPEQEELWANIVNGPRGKNLAEPPKTLPGPFGPWLQTPRFGVCAAQMGEILRLQSILPGDLREIAILAAGVRWKAEFEFWAHARVARAEGVSEPILAAMQAGAPPPFDNERQRMVHEAAQELLDRGDLSRALRSRLADELGWPATVELVTLVGFYCMVSFTLNAFDVGLPEGVSSFWPRG
jgi:4-carboxymuconolactone decarboxylase